MFDRLPPPPPKEFTPPTLGDVARYAASRGWSIDAGDFLAAHRRSGWGRRPCWKQSVRAWVERHFWSGIGVPERRAGQSFRDWYRNTYLNSQWWMMRRARFLASVGNRCQECGKAAGDVHHLTYARLGREADADLRALCRACHERHHPPKEPTDK